ncbi:MAG: ABC transporter ATP-binding protein [Oscillospiraceae bacterium]|nr:ABC transporter ATP-binding protein [Oscillospiraceae bacterium]
MSVLEVSGLCKRYPGFALENVTFSVDAGSIMGFIGRNGAGKTTTLKSLLGLVHPDAGAVRCFGLDFAAHETEIKQRIGYVVSTDGYYKKKKIRTITDVTRSFYPNWDEDAYRHYLEAFHLSEEKTPAQLSEGMKVKYSIALALSHRAELLILDEPTSGLDPVSREELLDVFTQLRDKGTSILFSTHITSDLEKCADAITYIKRGSLLYTGPKAGLGCGVEEFMIRNEKEDLHV